MNKQFIFGFITGIILLVGTLAGFGIAQVIPQNSNPNNIVFTFYDVDLPDIVITKIQSQPSVFAVRKLEEGTEIQYKSDIRFNNNRRKVDKIMRVIEKRFDSTANTKLPFNIEKSLPNRCVINDTTKTFLDSRCPKQRIIK